MPNYETLSPAVAQRMAQEEFLPGKRYTEGDIIRRIQMPHSSALNLRTPLLRDIDYILHCPYYNRYSDKTQVFSLLKNDDITRRSLHVQLVSRIARTIGTALKLDLDLIEAIALGHDLGHPPFAHIGETFLNEVYHKHTGRYFSHSIQSVRVLDKIFPMNLSLQVLDGIACHNGELELETYVPGSLSSFEEFDAMMERCMQDRKYVRKLMPSTLEGAVVRISDIIAYLGKDRQDASRINLVQEDVYNRTAIGSLNSEIIHNLVVNIIENSYGQPYIRMDKAHFDALVTAKRDNYAHIYESEAARLQLSNTIKPMMAEIYQQVRQDLVQGKKDSPIFTHHISYINHSMVQRTEIYGNDDPDQIVVDYIASMTDDYFIDLHRYLFPDSNYHVAYTGYFDEL